jgi:hypothetical protein
VRRPPVGVFLVARVIVVVVVVMVVVLGRRPRACPRLANVGGLRGRGGVLVVLVLDLVVFVLLVEVLLFFLLAIGVLLAHVVTLGGSRVAGAGLARTWRFGQSQP